MTVTEYASTFGEYRYNKGSESRPGRYVGDDPKEPEGMGWTMCGSAASDGVMMWFWTREVEGIDR